MLCFDIFSLIHLTFCAQYKCCVHSVESILEGDASHGCVLEGSGEKKKKKHKTPSLGCKASAYTFVSLKAAILCLIVPSSFQSKTNTMPWAGSTCHGLAMKMRLLSFYPGHALAIVFPGRLAGRRPRHRVRSFAEPESD